MRPHWQERHRKPCHGAMSGDLAGCMQRKAGADRTDLGFAGTYLEVWDFHTETSCVLEAAMGREGSPFGPLVGHPYAYWEAGDI